MKSKIVLFAILAVLALCCLAQEASAATPLRLSLLPGISIPNDNSVIGLDIGFIADSVTDMQGIQVSWLYSGSDRLSGIQIGLVNVSNAATGMQWGFYNQSQTMVGIQIGLINVTDRMQGLQIGLINIIRTGAPLPIMVFINGSF